MDMSKLASGLISVKEKAKPTPSSETPKKRKSLLIKLSEHHSLKLKEATYKTDKNKQTIMVEAFELWLEKNGI
jgi:hypothetical protein